MGMRQVNSFILFTSLFSFFSSLQFVIMAVDEIYELHIRFVAFCLLRLQLPAVTLGNNASLFPPSLSISLALFEVEAARASHAKLKFGREAC